MQKLSKPSYTKQPNSQKQEQDDRFPYLDSKGDENIEVKYNDALIQQRMYEQQPLDFNLTERLRLSGEKKNSQSSSEEQIKSVIQIQKNSRVPVTSGLNLPYNANRDGQRQADLQEQCVDKYSRDEENKIEKSDENYKNLHSNNSNNSNNNSNIKEKIIKKEKKQDKYIKISPKVLILVLILFFLIQLALIFGVILLFSKMSDNENDMNDIKDGFDDSGLEKNKEQILRQLFEINSNVLEINTEDENIKDVLDGQSQSQFYQKVLDELDRLDEKIISLEQEVQQLKQNNQDFQSQQEKVQLLDEQMKTADISFKNLNDKMLKLYPEPPKKQPVVQFLGENYTIWMRNAKPPTDFAISSITLRESQLPIGNDKTYTYGMENLLENCNIQQKCELLMQFGKDGSNRFAWFHDFWLDDFNLEYKMHIKVGQFDENHFDSIKTYDYAKLIPGTHNNRKWSTIDWDNDNKDDKNCANNAKNQGPGWFDWCYKMNPFGKHDMGDGMCFYFNHSDYNHLDFFQISYRQK